MLKNINYKRKSLSEVLKYYNKKIIERFIQENPSISFKESEEIFTETLKWLSLYNESIIDEKINFNLFIYSDSIIIDEKWHNFILFTKYYHSFCEEYFGRYIHHIPVIDNDNKDSDIETKLSELYGYIYDKLGEETLNLWFREFPEKYNHKIITH
ncbi:hypothetical protein [Fluviispira vulneris]|uniref:hypothetical protein n=1 Tax=Fluviispira vulneris TaxID=2763012 RepID=UPI0016489EE0|nr:hypothetical protein [Fluviispira vulneris]